MKLIAMFLLPGWVLGCASTAPSRGDLVPNPVVQGRLYDLGSSDLLNARFVSDPAVASRLPDEAEEPEPLDAANNLTDGEEELSDDLDAIPNLAMKKRSAAG